MPSPVKAGRLLHSKDPGLFTQSALTEQETAPGMLYSSTSKKKLKCLILNKMFS